MQREPASAPEATPFEITRDDAVPRIAFEPQPGEFGTMPEIRLVAPADATAAYSVGMEDPTFDNDAKVAIGQKFQSVIKLSGSIARIKARAISTAGVQSEIVSAEYRENRRLRGWNSFDIYGGGLYLATFGSVKDYLPTGVGGVLGIRYGLDSFLVPSQHDINARPFWLPGAWAETGFLSYNNGAFSESAIIFVTGPEWQLPLAASRVFLLTFGLGGGVSQLSVKTPTYNESGFTGTLQAKTGVEYQLDSWAVFAHVRYAYFGDQSAPLTGVGFAGGLYYKL